MTMTEIRRLVFDLSDDERLQLGRELVDSVTGSESVEPSTGEVLPAWLQELLDERIREADREPVIPWATVRAKVWGSTD